MGEVGVVVFLSGGWTLVPRRKIENLGRFFFFLFSFFLYFFLAPKKKKEKKQTRTQE